MKIRSERTFMPLCLLACVYLIAHAPTLFKKYLHPDVYITFVQPIRGQLVWL